MGKENVMVGAPVAPLLRVLLLLLLLAGPPLKRVRLPVHTGVSGPVTRLPPAGIVVPPFAGPLGGLPPAALLALALVLLVRVAELRPLLSVAPLPLLLAKVLSSAFRVAGPPPAQLLLLPLEEGVSLLLLLLVAALLPLLKL